MAQSSGQHEGMFQRIQLEWVQNDGHGVKKQVLFLRQGSDWHLPRDFLDMLKP